MGAYTSGFTSIKTTNSTTFPSSKNSKKSIINLSLRLLTQLG
jgi:hypothetical protein